MDIRVKVGIVDEHEEQFLGPGLVQLLDGIKKLKSIKKAAEAMGLSNKKAHKMVNRLEADLKEQVLVRRRGGSERGGTEITPLGEIYIAEYRRLDEQVKARAAAEFAVFEKRIARKKERGNL